MKKMTAFILCAVLMFALAVSAYAADVPENTDYVDNIAFRPGYTFRVDGKDTGIRASIMVPLRATAEQLGFTLTWNDDDTITVDDGKMHCVLTMGVDSYQVATSVEGTCGVSAPFELNAAPCTMNGVIYVPLDIFTALLGSQEGAVTLEDGGISLHTNPLGK